MARPKRNNVDYFPFICEEGNKMFYIEETYGNDGFATFVKLLRELAKANFHYLDLSKKHTQMFLSAKCKISTGTLIAIINDLAELGKFDSKLWEENTIIWCQDFIDSIQDAYNKRINNCIDRNGLLLHLDSLGVRKLPKDDKKPTKQTTKVGVNPQSKEEYSKLEDNKEDSTKKEPKPFDYKKSLLSDLKKSDVPNEEHYLITMMFYNLFKKNIESLGIGNNKTIKQAKGKWIDHVRLMIKEEERTKEQFRAVYDFLQTKSFWQNKILSTNNLRDKFDKLLIEIKDTQDGTSKRNSKNGATWDEITTALDSELGHIAD